MATTGWCGRSCSRRTTHPGGKPLVPVSDFPETFRAELSSRGITFNASSAMKLISFLSAAAVLGLGVSALAASFSAPAFPSYAAAASLLVVLGAVRDYSPRRSYSEAVHARITRFPSAPAPHADRLAA